MKLFFSLLILACSAAAQATPADNTYVGNGGHVIACFDQAAQDAFFKDGRLSTKGADHLIRMETLDYWVAKRSYVRPPADFDSVDIKELAELSFDETREKIHARFAKIGAPYNSMFQCLTKKLGVFTDGTAINSALIPVNDQVLPFTPADNCRIIQAVIRQDAAFYYSAGLISTLRFLIGSNVDQVAMMQLHEEFYAFAVDVFGHGDSRRSRNLLTTLLIKEPTGEELKHIMSYWGKPVKQPCETP